MALKIWNTYYIILYSFSSPQFLLEINCQSYYAMHDIYYLI